MKNTLPYLFIFDKNLNKLHLVNINNPQNISSVIDNVIYFQAVGLQSNYKNPFQAEFKRTRSSGSEKSSRLITKEDQPLRLNTEELVEVLKNLQVRGKDKVKRKINPNSLNNLKPAKRFSSEYQVAKPRLLNQEQLSFVEQLRQRNISFNQIGDELGIASQKIRNAYAYHLSKSKNDISYKKA